MILESPQKATSLLRHEKLPLGAVVICRVDVLPRLPCQLQVIEMLLSAGVIKPLMPPNPEGLLVNLIPVTLQLDGGVTPACVTCTDWPPRAMFPMRDVEEEFALAIKLTTPLPVPLPLPVPMVSHDESDTAVQAQLGAEAVKLILPAPPAAGIALAADSVNEHAASCMKFVT